MPITAYPTAAELTARLEDQGVRVPVGLENFLLSTIQVFEESTGFRPFLGYGASAEDYTFDPPETNELMSLLGGFWEIESVEIDGRAFTETTDYILRPLDAVHLGRGWDVIEFLRHPGTKRASIVINGKRGYAENLPVDAYEGIIAGASAVCIAPSLLGVIARPSMIKQGQFQISGSGEMADKAVVYAELFASTVSKYRRNEI